jgi:succinate dehydrogenase / fumarate reductase cytochrome b subunit
MHALGGLWMGCFLLSHLAIGVSGLSPLAYRGNTDFLRTILAPLPAIALVAIALPLLFQFASGLYLLRKEGMKYGVRKCNRGGKLRFFLQRATGLAILAFTLFHAGTLRGWGWHNGGLFRNGAAAFGSTVEGFRGFGGGVAVLCLLGIWAAAFHAANGAWSGGIIWSVAPAPESKRRWGHVCTVIGVVLIALGTVAWYAFTLSSAARAIS